MRIQKFLSSVGFCSRRKAEEYIEKGLVKLNGDVVKELGTKIDKQKDILIVDGEKIENKKEALIYIALNKPKDCISSCVRDKHKNEKIILDLVDIKERVYPIGRLDKDSTGLILLTNDGAMHHKLSHPSFNHEKEYEVVLNKNIENGDLKKLKNGVLLNGKKTRKAKVKKVSKNSFIITLKEGRNRQIRRMAEAINKKVINLKRIRIGNIKLKELKLKKGEYCFIPAVDL